MDKLIVALSADIKDLKSKLTEAQALLKGFGNTTDDSIKPNSLRAFEKELEKLNKEFRNTEIGTTKFKELATQIDATKAKMANATSQMAKQSVNSFDSIGSSIKNLIGAYVGLQAAQTALSTSFDRALKLDAINASMTAIMGSSELAAQQFQKLSEFANQYGLNLIAVADSYKNFSASATMANVPLEQTDYIFQAVAKAASVLKLSNDDLGGALNALSQMISKGTVQAEELRGQLGERLPGAFNLAAKAMGVTTQELGKMLERGEVMAGDLLPKLAAELNNAFGDKIVGDVDNLQASINRLDNSFTMAVQKGNIGVFFKEIVDGANDAIKILESNSWNEFFGRITALATGNEALKFRLDATTAALKQLNKEATNTKSIEELTKSFGTPTKPKATSRPSQEAMTPMQGASELQKEAKALFDLYKQTPDTLKTMGSAYANNPFFRDLINGDLNNSTLQLTNSSTQLADSLKNIKMPSMDLTDMENVKLKIYETIKALELQQERTNLLLDATNMLASGFGNAFASAIIDGKNFGDAMGELFKSIGRMILAEIARMIALRIIISALAGIATGGASAAAGAVGAASGAAGAITGGRVANVGGSVPLSGSSSLVSGELVLRGNNLVASLNSTSQRNSRIR